MTREELKAAAVAMLDRAYQSGVNYFDTAYFYHNGKSEAFMGRALARYPRESYYLTSKLPTTLVHSLEDAKRIYAEQRERLQKDYLDFYLLHNLNGARWHEMAWWTGVWSGRPRGILGTSDFPSMAAMRSFARSLLPEAGIAVRSSSTIWTRRSRPV